MEDREGQYLEFKTDWNDSAKKTAIAFANSGGGTILVGVNDDGKAVGVNDVDDCMLRIMQSISNGVHPDLARFTSIYPVQRDGMDVVTVGIRPGTNRPYYLSDKGPRPAGVYIRLGAGSIQASETAILSMIRESAGLSFEQMESVEQSLTFDRASSVFAQTGIAFTEQSKRTLGLINDAGTYTNLAWLLSDQCAASIKAAVFEGTDKSTFNSREEFTGSLFGQFQGVAEYIGRFNSTRSTFDGALRRVDHRDYSPSVLREALLNLVVHRDYSLAGPGLVSVFDDRVEFVNFGGLPAGMTKDDMMLGTSLQRNPRLASILYRLGWVEAYGTGVPKIIDDYRSEPVQPEFQISDNAFRLVLPSHNPSARPYPADRGSLRTVADDQYLRSGETIDERRRTVLSLVSRQEGASRSEIQQVTGLAQSSAGKLLREMIDAGLVRKIGTGRATRYHTAKK
ncbi:MULTISPECIES: RNA-binding domain-containing protein [Bifidobacterium]|uniref:RNA-binding domain-containing protein n=1 Tax=Bifidobacterium TaxID=1678 RepID=UPI001BDD2E8E|nr:MULTISPECIES: RNA-binding domain-containing protein [Bifidobacterium]MBT1160689.1 putative DNA binding domain-containing protein [Bifidobacterium sp. SO1]MBW3077894.1 putative DNA binding domain-containing protein [Bifidobacterium simiiventris]